MIDFSFERTESRKQLKDIVKVLIGKKKMPGIIYPAKLAFRNEDEIKSSPDLKNKRKRLGECIGSRPAFREYSRK